MANEAIKTDDIFPWQVLQIYSLYRLILVLMLGGYFVFENWHTLSRLAYSGTVILFYLIFALTCLILGVRQHIAFTKLCIAEVLGDIAFLMVLLSSNYQLLNLYGILINIAIAGGSIIVAGRISLVFAAVATISILLVYSLLAKGAGHLKQIAAAGIWGVTFFATAILAYGLSQRVRYSEALAKQRSEALAKLERLSDVIVERINSGVIVVDGHERVQLINKAAWYLLGMPERQGQILLADLSATLANHLQQWRVKTSSNISPAESLLNKGVVLQITSLEEKTAKGTILILLEDSARLAEQAQQDKLAALGRLTASIAHEIRNPLSSISHAAQLLAEATELKPQAQRLVEIVQTNATRTNDIIENILQLTRRKQATPIVFTVKPWLANIVQELKFAEQEALDITVQVQPEDLTFYGDISQLQQVVFNLCENGLRFSKQVTGRASLQLIAGLTGQGTMPYLDVVDFGPGIESTVEQYIFEPFFTTKKGGTGLGLYVARELCEANKARITYYPASHGGACFRILFHQLPTI
jgi:two-component system sensor histidine kinase PilS (NtrC family)